MMRRSRRYRLALILLLLASTMCAPQASGAGVSDRAPILIENVRPWDAGDSAAETVNVLISNGNIEQVSTDRIEPPTDAIDVDGEGRFIVGRLTVGEKANVIVMDKNPSADLTMLTDPNGLFLVVRDGQIESGEFSEAMLAKAEPTLRTVDPTRFRVIRVKKDPWYAYRSKRFNARFFAAALLDRTSFDSSDKLESQVGDLNAFDSGEVRTIRFGVGGLFKVFDKDFAYTVAASEEAFEQDFDSRNDRELKWINWDLGTQVFGANLRIGKQTEVFSHDRQFLLVDQPFMERAMGVSALTPSRNTGISLQNNALGDRLHWSAGAYFDMFGDRDEPLEDHKQYMTRISGLPYVSADEEVLVHLGLGYRYEDTDSGVLRFKTNPEAFFSPAFADTGEFPASNASSVDIELGLKQGPFWMISEYIRTDVDSNSFDDPTFAGFHVSGTWALTGEQRGYDRNKGLFDKLIPMQSVQSGGVGAWELVVRYSELDLSDGLVEGGDMSRMSIGVNWWPNRAFKGTIQYGAIDLDRFGVSSSSNVIQVRGALLLGF